MQDNNSITMLDTSIIIPNKYQPRKVFDERAINTLAESIKQYGIINPILVRKKEDKYEIIAGERRFRAAKLIGLNKVPVIIKNADEQEIAELALIENIQRQGLSPIEEAKSYEEIMRIGNQTQESLAKKIGKSQATIANKIRLLSLPEEIQDALAHNKISERHARSLLSVKSKERQIELLNQIITEKLTVKDTEKIINSKEIEENEIKQAISDIMKSLNIKEEEKEDDNMNNGNFFPNFDNNNTMNNNTSLNMMNMQSMNQQPIEAAPEMVMPTANPMMNEPQQMPMPSNINTMNQPMDSVQMTPNMEPTVAPAPEMNNNFNPMGGFMNQFIDSMPTPEQPPMMNPIPEPTMNQSTEQPMINNVPLFGMQPEPMVQPQQEDNAPTMEQPTTPMFDVPLFNQNVVMPSLEENINNTVQPTMEPNQEIPSTPVQEPVEMEQNSFDIPVINEQPAQVSSPVEQDKLSQLQEYLNKNGYTYKTFSNDNENCIIIELPRN